MGSANSCTCSEEKKYRFKGFVVSVYPDDIHGEANEDALGKLNSYVASNPERIPRVCRKITKLLVVQLRYHRRERVLVSVHMLRSLIEHAKTVDGFVPHTIDVCVLLLSHSVSAYKIGAADILSVLCYRLSEDSKNEPACRLIADSKNRLLPPLQKMCSEKIADVKDAMAEQCRYAAVVAIGSIARCLHGALASSVNDMVVPLMMNLVLQLRARATKPITDEMIHRLQRATGAGAPAPSSVQLPATDTDIAFIKACSFAIGATAGCVTTAGVDSFLSRVVSFLDQQKAWSVSLMSPIVFRALVCAMQERPQRLGFTVYQCLCDVGRQNTDPDVRIGVLRALRACMDALPMSGGRPQTVLEYLASVSRLSYVADAADDDATRRAQTTQDAIVALSGSLFRATYRQRNAPQLQAILVALLDLLREAGELLAGPLQLQRVKLSLRCMAVAAPYVRTIPLADRASLQTFPVIEPFLYQQSSDDQRVLAARVLSGILAGLPDDGTVSDTTTTTGTTAAEPTAPEKTKANAANSDSSGDDDGQLPPATAATMLFTEESDIAAAEAWVRTVSRDTTTITPRCVMEVGNVLTAIMAGYGVNALPFSLAWLWTLQQRCVRSEPGRPTTPTSLSGGGALSEASGVVLSTSVASTSPLTRAWLHLIVALLVSCGKVYDISKLADYGTDILRRRLAIQPTPELASCFEPHLTTTVKPSETYTSCGLVTASVGRTSPLSAELTEPPVSKLPSFSYIANILVDADREDVAAVFGGTASSEELKQSIEAICFSQDSEVNASIASTAAPARSPVKETESKRNGEAAANGGDSGAPLLAQNVTPAQQTVMKELKVSLAEDNNALATASATMPWLSSRQQQQQSAGNAALSTRIADVLTQFGVDAQTKLSAPVAESGSEDGGPSDAVPLPLFPRPHGNHNTNGRQRSSHGAGVETGEDDDEAAVSDLDHQPSLSLEPNTAMLGTPPSRSDSAFDAATAGAHSAVSYPGGAAVGPHGVGIGTPSPAKLASWSAALPSSKYTDLL